MLPTKSRLISSSTKALSYRDILEDRVEMLERWLEHHTSSKHEDINLSSNTEGKCLFDSRLIQGTFSDWVHAKVRQISHPYPLNENKGEYIQKELSFYRQLAELFIAHGAKTASENPDFQNYGIMV